MNMIYKGGEWKMADNSGSGRGWHGDPEGHREAGQQQGRENNPGNFANDREKARRAGKKGGSK